MVRIAYDCPSVVRREEIDSINRRRIASCIMMAFASGIGAAQGESVRVISPKRADRIIQRYGMWIDEVSDRYGIPPAAIKAVLHQEMCRINLGDTAADLAVRFRLLGKKDSSTGYAQIFGYVGVNAINFAVDRGLATYESLGFACDHRFESANEDDVRMVWRRLNRDSKANIEIGALNLLAAADEMVGSLDFERFTEQDLKLVFTRYNARTNRITPYGEEVFELYREYACGGMR